VLDNESVSASLPDDEGVTGVANVVGARAARDANATLDEQIAARVDRRRRVRGASRGDADRRVGCALASAGQLRARQYDGREPPDGLPVRDGRDGRLGGVPSDAQRALYDAAAEHEPNYFTFGDHAVADLNQQMVSKRRRSFCRSRWRSFSASSRSPTAISSTSSSA